MKKGHTGRGNMMFRKQVLIGRFSWKRMILAAVFIYLAVMLALYFLGNSLLFPAPAPGYELKEPFFRISVDNNEHISALYFENRDADFTILYSHGNAEDLGHIRPLLEQYRHHGYAVLAYDYRGYGHSSGSPSEHKSYADIEAAYKYLRNEIGTSPDRIIALGRSVGGGPTLHLATKHPVQAIILESTFVSASRVLTRIPLFPLDRFRNLAKTRKLEVPALFIHGTSDQIIPWWHGKKLYHAVPSKTKSHFWVKDAGHNDLLSVAGQAYWHQLEAFTANLPQSPTPARDTAAEVE